MTTLPRLVRAELFKLRTTPGPWVCFAVVVLLTGLGVTTSFLLAHHGAVHFSAPSTTTQLRRLMGAGYTAAIVMAPVLGVLCITTEYRHRILTATLLVHPRRPDVLTAKVLGCAVWGLFMGLVSFVMIAAMGIPLLVAEGGSVSHFLDQVGPVMPGMLAAYILLAVYGMGIGTLVRNQIAGVILALGLSLVLEPIVVAIFTSLAHMDVNFLPTRATQAIAGSLSARGAGGGTGGTPHALLSWWLGAVALVLWGLGTTVVGYFTTFRRDVT